MVIKEKLNIFNGLLVILESKIYVNKRNSLLNIRIEVHTDCYKY